MFTPDAPDTCADHRRDGNFAVRLGLAGVKTIGTTVAETIVDERDQQVATAIWQLWPAVPG